MRTDARVEEITNEELLAEEFLLYCNGGVISEPKIIPIRVSTNMLYYGRYSIPLSRITAVEVKTYRFGYKRRLLIRYSNGVNATLVLGDRGLGDKSMYVVQSALIQALSKEREEQKPIKQDNVIKGFLL